MGSSSCKRVFIRTDANAFVASGHVMRCLALADALRNAGMDVVFVVSDETPRTIIEGRGFSARVLASDWRNIMDGVGRMRDACKACAITPIVLVDTYCVTAEYVEALADVARVCYLGSKKDDLGNLSLLVNYSTMIDEEFYRAVYEPRGTRLLLGAQYAPLAERFGNQKQREIHRVSKVLVTTGNTDPYGFVTLFLSRALQTEELQEVSYEVVVGGMFENDHEIAAMANSNHNVHVNFRVKDMAALMAQCDAAVSANGTTVYELAAMGVAPVTFAMVDEQKPSAQSLARLGAIAYAGAVSNGIDGVVAQAIKLLADLVNCPLKAQELAARAHGLIDGKGAQRIAKEISLL